MTKIDYLKKYWLQTSKCTVFGWYGCLYLNCLPFDSLYPERNPDLWSFGSLFWAKCAFWVHVPIIVGGFVSDSTVQPSPKQQDVFQSSGCCGSGPRPLCRLFCVVFPHHSAQQRCAESVSEQPLTTHVSPGVGDSPPQNHHTGLWHFLHFVCVCQCV